jgi:hypothetical protein
MTVQIAHVSSTLFGEWPDSSNRELPTDVVLEAFENISPVMMFDKEVHLIWQLRDADAIEPGETVVGQSRATRRRVAHYLPTSGLTGYRVGIR